MLLYQGPSMLDGDVTIVAVMTGLHKPSINTKTGALPQVWIMRADVAPLPSVQTGGDAAVCGDCPLRPFLGARGKNACYVQVPQAPGSIWRAFKAERYSPMPEAFQIQTDVRIGAYGDPAAVPVDVWRGLRARMDPRARILGYTHQWRLPEVQGLQAFAMASCETLDDVRIAKAAGWRTFHAYNPGDAVDLQDVVCPASKEWIAAHNPRIAPTCATCRRCDGSARQEDRAPRSVRIVRH